MATLLAKSGSSSAVRARPSSRSAGPFLPARALARRAVTVRAQQQPQPTAVKPVDEKRWEEQVTAGKVRQATGTPCSTCIRSNAGATLVQSTHVEGGGSALSTA